jgi:hypothetical protein
MDKDDGIRYPLPEGRSRMSASYISCPNKHDTGGGDCAGWHVGQAVMSFSDVKLVSSGTRSRKLEY